MATLPCTPPGQLYYPANCTIADAPCATFKCKSCNSVLYACEEHFGLLLSTGIAAVLSHYKKNPHDIYHHLLKGDYVSFLPSIFCCPVPKCTGITDCHDYPTWRNLLESFPKGKLPAPKAFHGLGKSALLGAAASSGGAAGDDSGAGAKARAPRARLVEASAPMEEAPRELTEREKRALAAAAAEAEQTQREFEAREANRLAEEEQRRLEFQATRDREFEEARQRRQAEIRAQKARAEQEARLREEKAAEAKRQADEKRAREQQAAREAAAAQVRAEAQATRWRQEQEQRQQQQQRLLQLKMLNSQAAPTTNAIALQAAQAAAAVAVATTPQSAGFAPPLTPALPPIMHTSPLDHMLQQTLDMQMAVMGYQVTIANEIRQLVASSGVEPPGPLAEAGSTAADIAALVRGHLFAGSFLLHEAARLRPEAAGNLNRPLPRVLEHLQQQHK